MLQDPDVRRSLDRYISRRIRGIPSEMRDAPPRARRAWGCGSEADFALGYHAGRIEEGAMRYLLKATRARGGGPDALEIREMVEAHRDELAGAVSEGLRTAR